MTVVGAWSARGSEHGLELARRAAPEIALRTIGDVVLGGGVGASIDVGVAPTSSSIHANDGDLILRRGPAWAAPIYYRATRDAIVASSHVEPLVDASCTLDISRLAGMVGLVSRDVERRSIYRGIEVVQPFEEVRFGARGLQRTTLATPRIDPIKGDPRELAEELRRLVLAAVKRTADNRKVAVLVSGGLDSTMIVSALSALRGVGQRDLRGITLDFEGPDSDRPFVKLLEHEFGIRVVRLRPEDARSNVQRALTLDRTPSQFAFDPFACLFSDRAHDLDIDVLLTGQGGDEILGGDLAIAFGSRLRRGDIRALRDVLALPLPFPTTPRWRLRAVMVPFVRPHVPMWVMRSRARRQIRNLTWAGPRLIAEHQQRIAELDPKPEGWTPEARYDALARDPRLGPLVEGWARTASAGGAQRADPLYDEAIVRFAVAVPPMLHATGVWRSLQRDAMHTDVPEPIRRRTTKADFQDALASAVWPLGELQPLLAFRRLGDAGILNPNAARAFFKPLFDRPNAVETADLWSYFWPALSAEALLAEAT